MRIHIVCVGQRPPDWVKSSFKQYSQRMPRGCQLTIREVPTQRRGKNADLERLRQIEGEGMLALIPKDALVVALEVSGASWSSHDLSKRLSVWMQSGRDVALLVGGPDGLSDACVDRADYSWSLSSLTLPHALVRVLLAEQMYRAWTIINGHPYHRE